MRHQPKMEKHSPVGSPGVALAISNPPSCGSSAILAIGLIEREACSVRITLTVFFDGQFYCGLFERIDDGKLSVAKVVFGAEPKDIEIEEFILHQYDSLKYSPSVEAGKEVSVATNPKRRQRQASRAQEQGVGTKSQQAMQLAHEEAKQNRQEQRKLRREEEEQHQFELRTEKRKAKHRGH